MSAMQIHVNGIGLWSPELRDFEDLRNQRDGAQTEERAARPPASVLPANERRRAPESVLLAIEVAGQAMAMSGLAASDVPCVFSSTYGDQSISDYMCATLASAPTELSPTRFHNSVHNAPAGYWTIATGCHATSSAVSAGHASLGAGLLEATALDLTEQRPVLLVCSDIEGSGPLREMSGTRSSFGMAMLLSPTATSHTVASFGIDVMPHAGEILRPSPLTGAWYEANPIATAAWPLLQNLVAGKGACILAAAETLALKVVLETLA